MIFNAKNTFSKGKKATVYAHPGLQIKAATSYNTKTREIELYVLGQTSNGQTRIVTKPTTKNMFPRKPIKVKIKIPGSFIIVDGKRY